MSMPSIPDITPDICIKRKDAVNFIMASIAMEELALAHILNAEGEKLQYVLGTLKDNDPGEITLCDIMAVNQSIQKTLKDVIKAEMLLELKLEDAIELDEGGDEECTTTLSGRKIWRDGNNVHDTRPDSVKIDLLRDGEVYKSVDIDSAGNGTYAFKCLPVYKPTGGKYTYEIDEIDVPEGYTRTVEGNNVINTAKPWSTTIECTKTWDDNHNAGAKRPQDITVHLLQNDLPYTSQKVAAPPVGQDSSNFDFVNVPLFDSNGSPFVYKLDEDPIGGYEKNITGYHITNTLE